jgi:hypothetical protein
MSAPPPHPSSPPSPRQDRATGRAARSAAAAHLATQVYAELRLTQETIVLVKHELDCTRHAVSLLKLEYLDQLILFKARVLSLMHDQPPNAPSLMAPPSPPSRRRNSPQVRVATLAGRAAPPRATAQAAAAELRSTHETLVKVTHKLNRTRFAMSLLKEEYNEMMIFFWERVLLGLRDQPPNVRVSNEGMAEVLHVAAIPSPWLADVILWAEQEEN